MFTVLYYKMEQTVYNISLHNNITLIKSYFKLVGALNFMNYDCAMSLKPKI